jgi:hypothetical protein
MRVYPVWLPVFLGMILCLAPAAWAQEEADDEVISAEDERLPDEIPDEGEKPSPTSDGRTEVQEDHTVIPGDNLWDLCARYLNNPWYWPRVWSYNPEITNPHWIFPGQQVRFYPAGELPGEMLASRDFEVPEPVEDEPEYEEVEEDLIDWAPGKGLRNVGPVSALDIQRDAFVTPEELKEMGHIKGSREDKKYLSEYDPIYIWFNDHSAAQVGQKYMVVRQMREIMHPITGDSVGFYIRILGAVQVVHVDEEVATAIIATSLDPIFRGDKIAPWMPQVSKHIGPRQNSVELRGYIVDSRVTITEVGERHLVFIDQGRDAGVEEGNVFDVVRREDGHIPLGEDEYEMGHWDDRFPIEIFGRIMIVDSRPTASTGVVVASLRELRIGDRVLMSVQ